MAANSYWAAKKGREALKITWDEGPNARLSSAEISRIYAETAKQSGPVARKEGDAASTLGASPKPIEAVYEVPFLAHATMEPMNCTAYVRKNNCEVWVGTQNQSGAQRSAARITGFPVEAVKINTKLLGGGFGRRGEQDFVADAVERSKALNAPVKVIWSREDDIRHHHYRPATYNVFRAALDERGTPLAWMHRIVAPSIGVQHGRPLKDGIDSLMVEGAV